MLIFGIASQKGGVMKTTTATTLAVMYASEGARVLLVDMDNQGHSSLGLGVPKGRGVYEALMRHQRDGIGPREFAPLSTLIRREVRPGLDLLQGSAATAKAEQVIMGDDHRETILRRRLREVRDSYDLCFIDVGPTVQVLSSIALYACQGVIVPVTPGSYSEDGVSELLRRIEVMREHSDTAPALLGVYPAMLTEGRIEGRQLRKWIAEQGFKHVGPAVRRSDEVPKAARRGRTVVEVNPTAPVSADFKALAEWAATRMSEIA